MTLVPAELAPTCVDRGLASADPHGLAAETVAAWDDFLTAVKRVNLDARTRDRKLKAREVLARVGSWREGRQLPEILADAVTGGTDTIVQDDVDARVIRAHGDDSGTEIFAAIERARDEVSAWIEGDLLGQPSFERTYLLDVGSPLGVLPVLTYAHAAAFQLAVAARDLKPAGAKVPESLLVAGLRALVDTTGALAARMHITSSLAAVTVHGSVFAAAIPVGWTAGSVEADFARNNFPGIEGKIGVLLDIAAGRKNPVSRLRKRDLTIRELPQLMQLAPIARDVPGLPGGVVLRKAAGFLSVFGAKS